jgi:hypothetical protein
VNFTESQEDYLVAQEIFLSELENKPKNIMKFAEMQQN